MNHVTPGAASSLRGHRTRIIRAIRFVESRARTVDNRIFAMPPVMRWLVTIAVFFTILVARRPETLLRAEFVFEDGTQWYLGAWRLPLVDGIATPYAGYLLLVPRAVGYLERLVPVSLAPLLGNVVALFIVALVAAFIASDRLTGLIPSRRLRLVLALYFVVLPTTYMTQGSITFIQFYLAIFLVAAAVSDTARTRVVAAATYVALAVASATGPFGLLFLPLFAGRLVLRRETYSALMLASVGLPAMLQAATLLTQGRTSAASPTTDPVAIAEILAGHGAVALFGGRPISYLLGAGVPTLFFSLLGVVALGLLVLQLRRLPRRWLLVTGYIVAAIAVPALIAGSDDTTLLLNPLSASRYLVVVTATLGGGLIVALANSPRTIISTVLGAILTFGVVADFRLKPYDDLHWPETSTCIGGPAPCVVPVYPGGGWDIHWPGADAVRNR